ncbi:hypothetical protein R54876_GBNLAHCA_00261 [Eupransor demetentiae]|uniref:NADH dehydrogenase subunit 1 n=1 Tax=Eupransor demetentiae TaxID=3109584 RepID=A0ABP0EN62_9LACO|nr:hypothetical protein R54876_GBNLAHCA_00261 [Lactobacillaceae bacterium LMG 33000]
MKDRMLNNSAAVIIILVILLVITLRAFDYMTKIF